MKLIVGLGNPGNEYAKTRHNIGFQTIDLFAQKYSLVINKSKLNGLYAETFINNEKVLLLKPQLYINLSGEVVRKYMDFFKISIDDLLIIHDDLDLSVGTYKVKKKGSSGGHNGLKNIELNLATKEYKRIKIGISNNRMIDTKDYVLGKVSSEEEVLLNEVKQKVLEVIDDFLVIPFDEVMSKYNCKHKGDLNESI